MSSLYVESDVAVIFVLRDPPDWLGLWLNRTEVYDTGEPSSRSTVSGIWTVKRALRLGSMMPVAGGAGSDAIVQGADYGGKWRAPRWRYAGRLGRLRVGPDVCDEKFFSAETSQVEVG